MTKVRAVVTRAHAKINLGLNVLGVRRDGFHELRTVFQSLEMHDTMTCVAVKGPFRLYCNTGAEGVPLDAGNLVWRAATGLWESVGGEGELRDVSIFLEKTIPVGSGLGGGSSDAAATLRALARFWGLEPRKAMLSEVAATLGADVPFFLHGGTASARGRGDEIVPLRDAPRRWVVLLIPPFRVSTVDAYRWFDADADDAEGASRCAGPARGSVSPADVTNDLESVVARRHPEILELKAALQKNGAVSTAMSGSGSAVYGLYRGRRAAEAACRALSVSTWRVELTRTLGRREYARRAAARLAVRLPRRARIG